MKKASLLGIPVVMMTSQEYEEAKPEDFFEDVYCRICGGKLNYLNEAERFDAMTGKVTSSWFVARCRDTSCDVLVQQKSIYVEIGE